MHRRGGTLALRPSIRSTLVLLAMTAGAACPCAADDAGALARAGTEAIEARRFGDALQAFTKAAELRTDDAGACFGAGVAAFMIGQDDLARRRFECALERNPGFIPAAVWLGDLHYRAGRLAEAIAVYEAARRHAPPAGELQRTLDGWRREHDLQSRFREIRSERFSALFEAEADGPLARDIVDRLEVAYARVRQALGVQPVRGITVVLYTREQFRGITGLASWSVAAYDGRIRLPLAGVREESGELDRVLTHELVHAVIAMTGGRAVPAWLNEGLATVLEPAGPEDAEARLTPEAERPALAGLHRGFTRLATRDAEIAYASSARAVRRLIERHGVGAVVALLEDLGRGTPFDRAFEARLAMRYDEFAALAARE